MNKFSYIVITYVHDNIYVMTKEQRQAEFHLRQMEDEMEGACYFIFEKFFISPRSKTSRKNVLETDLI